jgi:hypothetical protein
MLSNGPHLRMSIIHTMAGNMETSMERNVSAMKLATVLMALQGCSGGRYT